MLRPPRQIHNRIVHAMISIAIQVVCLHPLQYSYMARRPTLRDILTVERPSVGSSQCEIRIARLADTRFWEDRASNVVLTATMSLDSEQASMLGHCRTT